MKIRFALCIPFIIIQTITLGQINFSLQSNKLTGNLNGSNYGVTIFDFDNDGDDDIYVCRTENQENLLFRNNGDLNFEEVGKSSRVNLTGNSFMAVSGDFDNDGDADLYVGNRNSKNALFLNNGNDTFTDIATMAGVDDASGTVALALADINLDGFLDIYVANINSENILYINNGDLTFTDETRIRGVSDDLTAMGIVFFDYDNDRDLDLYLTHDSKQPNILYENNGSGYFMDVSVRSNTNFTGFGMGADFADIDHDNDLDIYITNLYENALLLNNGDKTYTDISLESGTDDYGMGWGVTFLDYNNDSFQDIYFANNGYFSDYDNVLFENLNGNGFINISSGSVLASPYAGYGIATADFDNDGNLEIVVANVDETGGLQLFQNNEQLNNWVSIKLEGTVSNRSAIGSRVIVSTSGIRQIDEVTAGSGYASQNSQSMHFGLGNSSIIDEIKVIWPNGLETIMENVEVNKFYKITESGVRTEVDFGNETITSLNQEIQLQNSVYPNPIKDRFTIDSNSEGLVKIINSLGQNIYQEIIPIGLNEIELNTQLIPGLYYVVFPDGELQKILILN